MKKAFTLLELLVVLSIIGVLLGLVVSVASSSVQWSREWKASALCKVVQAGLAEYKIQNQGKWPDFSTKKNSESKETGREELTEESVKKLIHDAVKYSINECPIMDVTQLHVAGAHGSAGSKFYGRTFMEAVKGSERYPRPMSGSQMYFGYPEKRHGYFRSFRIYYIMSTDSMEVTKQ